MSFTKRQPFFFHALSVSKILTMDTNKYSEAWTKWLIFRRWHIQMRFHGWKSCYFNKKNLTEICSQASIRQSIKSGLGIGSPLLNSTALDKMAAISQTILSDASFVIEMFCILSKIALKFVPNGPEREREIKFIGLFENRGHRGPYSPYKPFNHDLYIGIIIFPHIDNPQYTGYD